MALVTKVNRFKHIHSMYVHDDGTSIIGLLVWFIAGFQFKGHSNDKQIQTLSTIRSSIRFIKLTYGCICNCDHCLFAI